MDEEKRKSLVLGVFLILIILAAALYFFWGSVFNRGKLEIRAEAPFEVEIFLTESIDCLKSPCELKLKPGEHNLILRKDGYKNIIATVDIGLWRTTELLPSFEIIPSFEEVGNVPEEKNYEYRLVDEGQRSKLVDENDPLRRPLAYFDSDLISPKIIGGKNTVLVQGGKNYIVDLLNNKRSVLSQDIAEVTGGKWSESGRYLAFQTTGGSEISILDAKQQELYSLNLNASVRNLSWDSNDVLYFVTDQAYSQSAKQGIHGSDYIELLDEFNQSNYLFGRYHPDEVRFTRVADFGELEAKPTKLVVSKNGEFIYFQSGEKNFRIVLRKF